MTAASLPRTAACRIACAVVAAELGQVPGGRVLSRPPHDWDEDLPIGDGGLGLDSLERLNALGAVAHVFGLDDATLDTAPPRTVGAWIDMVMRQHASGNGRITVQTSGSTGRPRSCVHAAADLLGETRFLATRFAECRRVVALVPAHHIYGMIWTAMLPAMLQIPVVVREVGAPLALSAGDLVVAVPDQWQALARIGRGFPPNVVGVSSGGPLDDGLAADLLAGGLARLVDIYGSSETGGIAMREMPAAAYTLLPRWRLVPDTDDGWQLEDDRGGRHALPDHVEPVGDRGLRPTGRRDGAVQVGGHNVWPERVADMLRAVDGVADAAVRLHSDGRLKAFVVPVGNVDLSELAGRIDCATARMLTVPERPKHLRFGTALPRNGMGKLTDWT